ncbi:MAG: ABC transporter ATP-binding protein [Chloroflexota bacterium]
MTTYPIIRLEGVTKRYGDVTAVDNVSLRVEHGEMLVLLGSSGCGKTTMLRLVAGLERPDSGNVSLEGKRVAGAGTWVQPEDRHIGMVFQDYALFPHMTVSQNIGFALNTMRGRDKSTRIADMLDLVGLSGLGKRFPHQLSGGQQQRVALARALAPGPSVVLLDEPFSNLDAALRKFMRGEVRRILNEAEATAIFVTHDQEEAMSMADQVAVMKAGRLLQSGPPDELYEHPAALSVATFLGEVNLLPAKAEGGIAQTPLGQVRLARHETGDVKVMLRPEAIRVLEGETATVIESHFFGYYRLLTVQHPEIETPLTVRVWAQDDFEPGSRVDLATIGETVAFSDG